MHAVVVRVIADGVLRHCSEDVLATSQFEHSRFLANHFECRVYPELCQISRDAQGGVIGSRSYKVFRVEPESDVNRSCGAKRTDAKKKRIDQRYRKPIHAKQLTRRIRL